MACQSHGVFIPEREALLCILLLWREDAAGIWGLEPLGSLLNWSLISSSESACMRYYPNGTFRGMKRSVINRYARAAGITEMIMWDKPGRTVTLHWPSVPRSLNPHSSFSWLQQRLKQQTGNAGTLRVL